jgi:hypothetical protein
LKAHRNIERLPAKDCKRATSDCLVALLPFLFSQQVAEAIETALSKRATTRDPAFCYGEPCRLHAAGTDATDLLGADETALFEHLQVLDDRGERHIERSGKA